MAIYDPKSMKAEEFINDAEIRETIAYANANPSDNPGKFQDIVKRRLRSGQAYMQPYLGCRECTAHFRLWEGGDIPTIDETRGLGYMIFDMDYSDLENIQPMFFRAQMVHGVIDLTDCEVVK